MPLEVWERVIAVNLRGPFLCAKYTLPHLIASGRGAIVNIASTFGMIGAHGSPVYAASKGGVIALTRQLAVDYGPTACASTRSALATPTPTWTTVARG